jgi:hypothetical protein
MTEGEHTTAKLARALEPVLAIPRDMVERAKAGYYHDFLSPLDMPEVQLVADLRAVAANRSLPRSTRQEIEKLAQRVIAGEFDASREESEAWAASPEGQAAMADISEPTGPDDGIWIQSTRGPDDEPVCEITWGPLQYYAPVGDVRETAIDLVTCAAYAEMMMTLIVRAKLPPDVVSQFATDLLSGRGKRYFGAKTTMTLLPAGSSKRREALVLLKRGSSEGSLSPGEARAAALRWLEVAEATESDQLVSEALTATGVDAGIQEKLFGYLRELRSGKAPERG